MTSEPSRRDRKKAATRQSLSDAAVRLFIKRGYDEVTVADIAAEADTAVTTLFAHFPEGKQALVFGGAEDRAAALVAAVHDPDAGVDPLDAVQRFMAARGPFGGTSNAPPPQVLDLIRRTPALTEYARRRWVDCEDALTHALADELQLSPEHVARSLARFILEAPQVAGRADNPKSALEAIFRNLRRGWLTS